ncbi:MAG: DUF819 domain-containing protein [Rhodothermales bacterium]|jgi:uncharacterized membrane protein
MTEATYIIGVLSAVIFLTEYLVRKTFLKHFGTALLVILFTALLANVGLLPTGSSSSEPIKAYTFIFDTVAPLAIFWLLLPINLRDIMKAGRSIILMFLLGSLATAVGVFAGMWVVNGPESIGPLYSALGGMFVGTYTGGSVNFNTLGLHYGVMEEGVLYGGSIVVDNIVTTLWMVVSIAVPRAAHRWWPKRPGETMRGMIGEVSTGEQEDTETMHPLDVGVVLALGLGAVWFSEQIAALFPAIPSALFLTGTALLLAQVPGVSRLPGLKVMGMFAVYLFLCVIGAFCDLGAMRGLGSLGSTLLVFTIVTVLVHGLLVYGLAWIFRVNPVIASIASQANVGGGTSALALARSLGREDLVLPSILIGSLGYAVGTFLGFWVAEQWLPLLA